MTALLLLLLLLQALVTEIRQNEDDFSVTVAGFAEKDAKIEELNKRIADHQAVKQVTCVAVWGPYHSNLPLLSSSS
jgi:hypothetical protein